MSTVTYNLCLKSFTSKGNLNRHICSVHLKEKWSCDICGKVQSLLKHEENMHEVSRKHKQNFASGTQKRRKFVEDSTSEKAEEYTSSEGDSESSSLLLNPLIPNLMKKTILKLALSLMDLVIRALKMLLKAVLNLMDPVILKLLMIMRKWEN